MTLQERHEQILDRCVESLKTWKDLIAEYIDEDDSVAEINKLKETTESYCDISRKFKSSLRAIEKTEEQLGNESEECTRNVKELFEENLKQEEETTEEYTDSDIWQNVFKGMSDVMEVKSKRKKLNDSEFEELGDSLFCSNVFTPPIDPISKVIIRDPVRSRKCKHVYERAMITDYIKQQKRKAKCPYVGCSSKQLLMSDITEDSELQSQITQYMENRVDEDTDD
ncbi:E3 SUMO-protein ligase NSE2-like [Anoplophora glabripennis]|uniref:E3 SUMO-protein ligase NSE2-like n=1 Tax=Anoplophora glabripennis TaxID=217634 RepID=UPI0008735D2E|nr:E3 SUMO-protein ligase NSE2-like [Anoplophora glabripennis]